MWRAHQGTENQEAVPTRAIDGTLNEMQRASVLSLEKVSGFRRKSW
jgi:hypothetical protein